MASGRTTLSTLVDGALAPRTLGGYRRYWDTFRRVTGARMPLGEGGRVAVERFILWAYEGGRKKSWAQGHLAVVAYFCRLQGGQDPTKAHHIRAAMKGWGWLQARPRDRRRPLDFDKLKAVLHALRQVCTSRYERTLFRAAFTLTFYGAYQLSEVVAPSCNSPGSACLRGAGCYTGQRLR